jgi:hypothetical protein
MVPSTRRRLLSRQDKASLLARQPKSGATFLPHVEMLEERALLSFVAPVSFPGGASLTGLAAADFNGDGKLDLVGIVPGTSSIGVMLGNNNGTFQAPVTHAAGTAPQALAVGDFNHDGKLDVAVANAGGVSILLGKGDGTFQPTFINYAAGVSPTAIAVGDFNGDGTLDLAVANKNTGTVSILLGKGDGTFRSPVSYAAGPGADAIAVADFNGDGKLDLAVADFNGGGPGKVSVLRGNGDGTFQAPVSFATGAGGSQSVVAGDFNGDGTMDLAVANNDFTVSLLLGNGDGSFKPAVNYASGRGTLVVGDFNNDHNLDLASLSDSTGRVSVLSGNGDGTFRVDSAYSTNGTPSALAVGDFNNDHLPDLAVSNGVLLDIPRATHLVATLAPASHAAAGTPLALTLTAEDDFGNTAFAYTGTVLFTSSDAGATLPNSYTFTSADKGTHTFPNAVDFWTAGQQTLTATDPAGPISVTTGFQVTPGAPLPAPDLTPHSPIVVGAQPVSLAVGDFNGDGKPDVVTANFGEQGQPGTGSVSVLPGNGDGTFQTPSTLPFSGSPIAVVTGDFNGDGKPDLAVADFQSGTVSIFLGKGDGTFKIGQTFAVGAFPLALAVADVNGDHKLDLLVTLGGAQLQNGASLAVFMGQGDGTFVLGQTIPVGPRPSAVAVGDFNGDHKPDLVVTSALGNTAQVFLNNGTGTFKPATAYPVGAAPAAVKIVDLNGDGKLDLVTVNATSSTISVLLGNGDGTFQPAVNYAVGEDPQALAVGDLNGDGKLDLIVTANYDHPTGTVTVLLGNGDGTFEAPVDYGVGYGPVPVAVADLNGDGAADLIVGNAGHISAPRATLSVLLNPGASEIQLGSAAYSAQEGAASATITVTRTGDTSGTVSVHYATRDGLAVAGVDYTASSGTLTFNPGDTSATFTVPLLDDHQLEGIETVNLTLSGPTGGATLVDGPSRGILVIRDDNDGTANQRFVAQVYQDLLHRAADPGGLAAWSSLIDRGMARVQVVADIEKSAEFLGQEVQQIYLTYLGRPADPSGLNGFVSFLGNGGTVERVTAYVVSSAEYYNRAGGSITSFLTALYHDLLGRDPDAPAAAFWSAKLRTGWSRVTVAMSIVASQEAIGVRVQGLYQRYLRRAADPAGLNAFSWDLAHGFRDEQIIAALVGSAEYFGNI